MHQSIKIEWLCLSIELGIGIRILFRLTLGSFSTINSVSFSRKMGCVDLVSIVIGGLVLLRNWILLEVGFQI